MLDTHRQVVGRTTSFSSCSTSRSPSDALASAVESALRLAFDLDCFLRRRLIVSACRGEMDIVGMTNRILDVHLMVREVTKNVQFPPRHSKHN